MAFFSKLKDRYNKDMNLAVTLQNLQQIGCQYAFYFHRQDQEPILHLNCERFPSASIIKIPILLAWLHLEQQGQLSREELCSLDSEPQVRGSGFAWMMRTRSLFYADVLLMMIATSDNLCTNLVLQRIGLERAARVIQEELGLKETLLQRRLMDFAARSRGLDNWISAQDCIRFYTLLDQLAPQDRAWVDSLLRACQDEYLFGRGLPRDTMRFHHKTGSIPGILHDWAYTKDCRLFLLTQNVKDEVQVGEIFGEVGKLLAAGH